MVKEKLTRRPLHRSESSSEESSSSNDKFNLSTDNSYVVSPVKGKDNKQKDVSYSSEITDDETVEDSPKEHLKKNRVQNQENWNYIVPAIVIVAASFLLLQFLSRDSKQIDSSVKSKPPLDEVMKYIKQEFSYQHDLSLKIIKQSLKKILNADVPKTPSVVLLMSFSDGEVTTNCLAEKLAEFIYQDKKFVNLDGLEYLKKDAPKVKKEIDDRLNESAIIDNLNVFLIRNIDYLSGKAASIFYKYCDEESAVFKNAIIILTISGKETIPSNIDLKNLNSIAKNRLTKTWTDLSDDEFNPLYNRIAGSVSGIVKEPKLNIC